MIRRTVEKIPVDRDGRYRPFKLGPHDELEMRADSRGKLIEVYVIRVMSNSHESASLR